MLAKPLSKTLIYLATARWWSDNKRPPTPVSDLRPFSTPEMNSAVLAKSTPRQEGWAVIGENTHIQTYPQTHKDTHACNQVTGNTRTGVNATHAHRQIRWRKTLYDGEGWKEKRRGDANELISLLFLWFSKVNDSLFCLWFSQHLNFSSKILPSSLFFQKQRPCYSGFSTEHINV